MSFLRLVIAAVTLALGAPLAHVRLPRHADLPLIALRGATGMTACQLLLNWGEIHVDAGTASLLISVAPVFSVLLGTLFLHERLRGTTVVSLAEGTGGFAGSAPVVLGAALVQGVYHFASKPLLRHYSGLEAATYAMIAGTLFALPLLPAACRAAAHAPAGALLSAVYLGLLPSALGFVIWAYAVARLPLATSTGALYLVPPVALVVSFLWLGETPPPRTRRRRGRHRRRDAHQPAARPPRRQPDSPRTRSRTCLTSAVCASSSTWPRTEPSPPPPRPCT